MNQDQLQELFDRYEAGLCSPEEEAQLKSWLTFGRFEGRTLNDTELNDRLQKLEARLPLTGRTVRLWPRVAVAASILVMLSAGAYFLLRQGPANKVNPLVAENILPARQGVTLAVAGQPAVTIAYHHRGTVTAGSQQIAQTDSLLTYTKSQAVEMQTLTNNSGHRITIQLADGTEATLDVASELRYPSAFTGSERRVSLAGQAYFKVKHNAKQPFRVQAGEQLVEDIGTEFNVNTFQNTSTTLIEGSVKILGRVLKPGEMATSAHGALSVAPADVSEVVAWLQDRIMYKNARLGTVMEEVSRVYHVKIVWQDDLKDRMFYVILNRKRSLAGVLNYFRKVSDVDFKLEDQVLTVFKKRPTK